MSPIILFHRIIRLISENEGYSLSGCNIIVSVAPRIEPFSFGDPIYAGQSTQITCFVSEGDLPLNLFWTFHDTETLPLRGGISVNKMGSKVSMLYIEAATSFHAGNYTCIATNRAGRANYSATLNVHGKMATDLNVETQF